MRIRLHSLHLIAAVTAALWPGSADAFCGFYVSGAGADMFNNATQVVLMREGTRTVLSMQNNYQGPPENFAMVVPVPAVLQKDNVKTLDAAIFNRVDRLAAPRLVEYWEEDPCGGRMLEDTKFAASAAPRAPVAEMAGNGNELGVTIEAQFKVGEYEIVILSAKDSTGLDTWLRQQKYQIPQGAEPLLRPYVEAGSKFFVAKVDTAKVTFQDGMAKLSPLRFYYDSDEFSLPVRLGMINSSGTQDLIVHILAQGKRYEVANYNNATIPTNLDVNDAVRARFGEFYAALFDATLEKNKGAVVTEYSWDASSCDPCPTPALSPGELTTLGQDVLYTPMGGAAAAGKAGAAGQVAVPSRPSRRWRSGFVLTRLHARYGPSDMAADLVFKEAPAIAGGREFRRSGGALEQGAQPAGRNNFQARYAIRHAWTGPITCENPVRGRWGGPPAGVSGSSKPAPATDLAFAKRGQIKLASMVARDIPELNITAGGGNAPTGGTDTAAKDPAKQPAPTPSPKQNQKHNQTKKSKGCSATGTGGIDGYLLYLLGALMLLAVHRRRRVA